MKAIAVFILVAMMAGCGDVGAALQTSAEASRLQADAVKADAQARLIEAQTDAAAVQALRDTVDDLQATQDARVREAYAAMGVLGAFAVFALLLMARIALVRARRPPDPPATVIVQQLPSPFEAFVVERQRQKHTALQRYNRPH